MNEIFNNQRLINLIKNDIAQSYRSALIAFAALGGVIFLISIANAGTGNEIPMYYEIWYWIILYFFGAYITDRLFLDMHSKDRNMDFLLLPASALEKTLAKLIYASLLFPISVMISVIIFYSCFEAINQLVFDRSHSFSSSSLSEFLKGMITFLSLQSILFLGAAWFKKNQTAKTVVAIILIASLLLLLCAAFFSLVIGIPYWLSDSSQGFEAHIHIKGYNTTSWKNLFPEHIYTLHKYFTTFIFYLALPLFCWYVAFLRVKEAEVSRGI